MRSDFRDISDACAKTMLDEERLMILRFLRTQLLSFRTGLNQVKLQEDTYLQTPCKPEPKATCVTSLYSLTNNWNSL